METIILQETDPAVLEIITVALQMEHFNVYAVLDPESNFLELIDELRPHVIMLDYRLNGASCIKICKEIKAKYPHLPVIALSCNNNIHDEYNKYGFDDYIPKPFDLDNLYAILRKYIPKQLPKAHVIETLKKAIKK
jgi:DNA-binding response OmpR family regulator